MFNKKYNESKEVGGWRNDGMEIGDIYESI